MKNQKQVARDLVAAAGLDVRSMTKSGSGHIKVEVAAPDGRTTLAYFANTPSDYRGNRNKLADLRRFARGDVSPKHNDG